MVVQGKSFGSPWLVILESALPGLWDWGRQHEAGNTAARRVASIALPGWAAARSSLALATQCIWEELGSHIADMASGHSPLSDSTFCSLRQPRRSAISWAALKKGWPAGGGR